MQIDPGKSVPLYQQIAEEIRRQIHTGLLPVGSRLPPFRGLAELHGVSVMTIHKALSALISDGLLSSQVGRGTFVCAAPTAPTHSRRLFGFVLRDLSSPYFSLIARGAQTRAEAEGYALIFSATADSREREDEQIRRFRSLGVDGLIIASMARTYRASEEVRALQQADFPFVMVAYTHDEDVPFIGTDPERVGFLATHHLLEQGRRRIGYVNERTGSMSGELRRSGYRRALQRQGHRINPALEWEYPFAGECNDYRSGYQVGEEIASLRNRPDAVFVYNDLGAIGLLDALLERGVQVPEELALVGVDGIDRGATARVPLTTVRQATARIGAMAVETLVRRLAGERVATRQLLEPELVVRRSCGAPGPAAVTNR